MTSQQDNSSVGASATSGCAQRFQLIRRDSQQRAGASSLHGVIGAGRQLPDDRWQALGRLRAAADNQAVGTAFKVEADSGSGRCSPLQAQAKQRTAAQTAVTHAASSARFVHDRERMQDQPAPLLASQLGSLRLTAPLARYPEGARVLHAGNRDFWLVPLSDITDESYTAYFDMVSRRFPQAVEA